MKCSRGAAKSESNMMLLRSMFLSTQDRLKTPFSSIFSLEVPNLGAIRAQKDKPHEQALRTLHGYGSSSQGLPLPSKRAFMVPSRVFFAKLARTC